MKICDFTMPEVRFFLAECNFTKDEEDLFLLRVKDTPLERCAEAMNVSTKTIDRLHKKVKDKIGRTIRNEMYQGGLTYGTQGNQD